MISYLRIAGNLAIGASVLAAGSFRAACALPCLLLGGGDLGDQLGALLTQVGEQLPRVLLRHDAALDPGAEIASLGDHVGQRLLNVVLDGSRLLRLVIRLVLDALRRSGSMIFVLRERRVELLRHALLLMLADRVRWC